MSRPPVADVTCESISSQNLPSLQADHPASQHNERWQADALMRVVIPIGVALANETDYNRLLERILIDAMALCCADGGTLYLCTDENANQPASLQFKIMRLDSLHVALGGTTGAEVQLPAIPLIDPVTGEPNSAKVAAFAAVTNTTVNVPDVYGVSEFDFTGPKLFDQARGYRTRSLLAVPLRDHLGKVIGVVQLVNARSAKGQSPIAFEPTVQQVIESLCLLASSALLSYVRQQALRDQVKQLRIEIDATKRDRQVLEITESDYFKALKGRVTELQRRVREPVELTVGDQAPS